ncbi:uncharacterized protein BJX67DRAFT_380796 [Aspergillus lucknowensis]|uniref:Uncharacterized protein n=1 Tax=Aspergillus lucknowensis TaxID=176173 RepID=A0ABR4LVR4_9EURO
MPLRDGPFFCHICGAPPTWRGLLAESTLQRLHPEEDDFDREMYGYADVSPDTRDVGYDARLLCPRNIRWLDAARLITNKIADTVNYTKTESPVPMLSPLAGYVNINISAFHYPENTNVLYCNDNGYLVYDTCFNILKDVYKYLHVMFSTQDLDLGWLWNWLQSGLEDRNNDRVDWGFGNIFHDSGADWPGQRFDSIY